MKVRVFCPNIGVALALIFGCGPNRADRYFLAEGDSDGSVPVPRYVVPESSKVAFRVTAASDTADAKVISAKKRARLKRSKPSPKAKQRRGREPKENRDKDVFDQLREHMAAKRISPPTLPQSSTAGVGANTMLLHSSSFEYLEETIEEFSRHCRFGLRLQVHEWAMEEGLVALEREAYNSPALLRFTLKTSRAQTAGYFIVTFRLRDARIGVTIEHRTTFSQRERQFTVELIVLRYNISQLIVRVDRSITECQERWFAGGQAIREED